MARYRGITEVGHVVDNAGVPTDTPWGKTTEDGVNVTMGTTRESLYSGQDLAEVESAITRVEGGVTFRMIESDPQTLARLMGLPDTAVSGTGAAATLTVLADQLGTEEFHLYAIQPGPDGPRRFDFPRTRVADIGDLALSKTAWTTPESTFSLLVPDTGELFTVGPVA